MPRCEWCDTRYVDPNEGKRGRPRLYCSTECKDASAALNVLFLKVDQTIGRMSVNKWREHKRTLVQIANSKTTTRRGPGGRFVKRERKP